MASPLSQNDCQGHTGALGECHARDAAELVEAHVGARGVLADGARDAAISLDLTERGIDHNAPLLCGHPVNANNKVNCERGRAFEIVLNLIDLCVKTLEYIEKLMMIDE